MNENRLSQRWLTAILLLVFFGVALYFRIALAYKQVFVEDTIKFTTNDAYYFVRQVDNLVHNFPHLFSFDPYLNYPAGYSLGPFNFLVYLLGGIAWFFGLGSPSAHLLDTISVYFPAILGALTVILVYFIGKSLFNRGAGLIGAALIAILPGEFLGRTMLGVTDRDSLEILLTTLTMLCLILAVKSARERELTFQRLNTWHLPVMTRPIIYSILSGIMLGLCVLTWRGSFIFVIIIFAYFIIQSIIDYFEIKSFDYLSFVSVVTFAIALLLFGVASRSQLYSAALAIPLVISLVLSALAWLLVRRKVKSFYYPMAVIVIGLLGIGIFYSASPSLFKSILNQFSVFTATRTELTISQMQSILFPGGLFTLSVIWDNYTTSLILSLIALGILIYLFFKRSKVEHMIIIVWSLLTLCATLDIRRIAPFFAITVALLTGYLTIIFYYALRFLINSVTSKSNNYVSSRLAELTGSQVATTIRPIEVSTKSNYYKVLGVPKNATHKQIKKTHAKLASRYQTGGGLTDEVREKLRQIDRAYAVLSDPQKRAAYDHSEYGTVAPRKDKAGKSKSGSSQVANGVNMAVAGLVIFFLVFFPNFKPAASVVHQSVANAPSDAWCSSLAWLRDNTPEPLGNASAYYESYQTPFKYPETTYAIAAWWDYGYWILRIGQRLPNCDPGMGARESVALLFTSQNETVADKYVNNLNSKYIIVDDSTVTYKFDAISTYSGTSRDQFFDVYYISNNGKLNAVFYYYPQYYQSLAVRLYNFDGKKIIPTSISVISYEERVSQSGVPYKLITGTKTFNSYQEATDYIAGQKSDNYRIASADPSVSNVPLDQLEHYKLVYSSNQSSSIFLGGKMPAVKIFEYTK